MKKAREYWITYSPITNQLAVEAPFDQNLYPSAKIHVREVLDPDPKDEVIKIMREALEFYAEAGFGVNGAKAEQALAAVEKLERE